MRRFFALSAFFALAGLARADAIDRLIESAMKAQHIPGLSLEIVRDGKVIKRTGYGFADLEAQVKMTPECVLEIGSITKQFTAASVLLLQDRGQLSVDDTLGKYLTELPEAWQKLTIRQVMSHTSGLKDYLASSGVNDPARKQPMQLVKLIGSLPFDFTPGTGWSYSNTGFLLLGMVVEKVSGKPLETYLADNFFKPLGLKTLTTTTPQTLVPHRSRGYAFDGKQFLNVAPTNPTLATGAGFLMGTVDDLSKWADSLSPQHALSLSALAAMNTPIRFTDGSEGDYGFGQFLFWDKGVPLIAHGGNTLGFSADLYRIPSRKFSVVILTNAANLDPEPLARHMAAILLPEMDLEKRKPAKDPRPDQTVKLKEWLNTAAKGKVDKTLFAPSFAVRFGALRGLSLLSGISGLGKAVRSLSYLDEDDQAKERRVRYRLEVEGGTAFLEIHWSPADQITTLQVIYSVEKPKPPTVPNAPAKRP